MEYMELENSNNYSYVIEKNQKSITVNITKELSQMKDIEPLDILNWIYDDLIRFLEENEDDSNWEVEFNKENSIDGRELIIPNVYESTTLKKVNAPS